MIRSWGGSAAGIFGRHDTRLDVQSSQVADLNAVYAVACPPVPELPELEVLREYLGPRLEGRKIAQVWTSPKLSFLLRTPPDEYARQLIHRTFDRVWPLGKFLTFSITGHHLIINPMLAPLRKA